jgi:hypothetical protein
MTVGFHTAGCTVSTGSMRTLPDEARHELGEIAPVMQPFVIDGAAVRRVGGSFNAKDWTPPFDFQRRCDFGVRCHCVQLVIGLDQRNIVFAFKK